MNCNRPIAKHGFRACGGNGNVIACFAQGDIPVLVFFDIFIGLPVGERIFEMPHMAVDFGIFDFKVRNGGFKMGIPIDQSFAAINKAFVIHLNKNLKHRIMKVARLFTGWRGFCA